MTEEFCENHKLFTYQFNRETGMYEIADRDYRKVKAKLLFSLTNFGQPFIYVVDGNYKNRGELFLRHKYEGIPLKVDYAQDTLRNIQNIWRRPVYIETIVDNHPMRFGFDGNEVIEERIEPVDKASETEAVEVT